MARTSTYLNFPRRTEEVFNFYKEVFGGEFGGNGIARFRDVPSIKGVPELSESDKNLVMHIELAIIGGHVLMGTDAPETMGFTVLFGNNMHINLEPGNISMPLQDMFWGSYYGSCTDKYGVQWMFNCTEQV